MRAHALIGATTQRVRLGAAAWAERRQGQDRTNLVLKRRRVYILPSRFGVIFGLLVFAMILGSMNYASSLGFGLAFLLTGLGLVVMHHCHNNLMGTRIRFSGAQPVYAGEVCRFRMALMNDAQATRYELSLHHEQSQTEPVDLGAGESETVSLRIQSEKRGPLRLQRYSLATRFPGNLFRAWSWIHMRAECIVYPKPAGRGRPLPLAGPLGGSQGTGESGDADFAGLRTAAHGDPPQRIAWKAFARNEELLSKQFAGGEQRAQILHWDALTELDTEERLSQLAQWCLDAVDEGCAFGLAIPGKAIPLGSGRDHLHECLTALALYNGPTAA
ncbi:MAG: DUF58 domain-containing protein [Candidatus Rariloculaceae bacterium]